MSPWVNFLVVICTQFLFLLFLAYQKKTFDKITLNVVVRSVVVGMIFGIAFDLIVGKSLGIFSYALRFDLAFLIINGAFSYGLWMLTIYLLRFETLSSFFFWLITIGLVYEFANHFYPVWSWTFGGSLLYRESMVIFVAYCGLGMLTALIVSLATQTQFRAFKQFKWRQ